MLNKVHEWVEAPTIAQSDTSYSPLEIWAAKIQQGSISAKSPHQPIARRQLPAGSSSAGQLFPTCNHFSESFPRELSGSQGRSQGQRPKNRRLTSAIAARPLGHQLGVESHQFANSILFSHLVEKQQHRGAKIGTREFGILLGLGIGAYIRQSGLLKAIWILLSVFFFLP